MAVNTMSAQINIAEIKLSKNEIDAAVRVLESGALRQGKECAGFEEEFAAKVGAQHALTCANGTASLHLPYMTILEPGDEVLVPSLTFIATASTVSLAGGKPIFCDVDPETYLIDLADAEQRISPRTRAIAPVHLFGNACDIEAVEKFAKKHNLLIVWDAAQAHGATYKGQDVGKFGDFVSYSFYPSKNMFVGEGGMICTNNSEYEEHMRYLRAHGQTGKYYHTILGLNYRMTDVEAAIGREQLKRLDDMLVTRRRNAQLLNEGLKEIQGITPQRTSPHVEHAWHQYSVTVEKDSYGCDKDALASFLNGLGVSTGIAYPRGLHQQPIFETMYGKTTLPITEKICSSILNIPVHHGLQESDILYMIDAIRTKCTG